MTRAEAPTPQELFASQEIEGWRVYVVDAHSLIFQVFHAIPEMTSPRGEPVSAVYGFTRDILYLLEQKRPDALICAFDTSGPTFRHDQYELYKADRSEMPDALGSQIPKILDILGAMAVPVLSLQGFEADDILATIARICDENLAECYLVTGDKDCRQLITDHVAVYNIRKDEVFDKAALRETWGIEPRQVVDFQALVGDKIDNVPGVPGIGPKTARDLLVQFGNLEGILAHADQVKGRKTQQTLRDFADVARLSQQLVRLSADVPIEIDWHASRPGGFDAQRLAELFAELGFRSLGQRLSQLTVPPTETGWKTQYTVIDGSDALAELVVNLSEQALIAVDTETTSKSPCWAELVGMSLAWKPGEAYYLPFRAPEGEATLNCAAALEVLKPILENPQIRKVGQNLKYDLIALRRAGVEMAGISFDTMVASYLLDAGERNHSLDDLAQRYLNHQTISIEEVIGKGKAQKRMDEVSVAKVGPYAAEDAEIPLRLMPLLSERLDQLDLSRLNDEVETPLIEILAEMEINGVRIDVEHLRKLSIEYGERLHQLEQEIEELAGHPFNIASPKQLSEVLYYELKLPVLKKTKTGPSTDAAVLEQLAALHPLPAKITEHRQYAKLKGTYVDALPQLVHPETGRVHCSFNQVVTATGRLSSSEPNLQNIPIRTLEGREIRAAFVAREPGWKLLTADYSQIELRVLAHFSRDETLCDAFATDQDIHTLVASQVNDVALEEVTPAMRSSAKAVNFGIIYGQSPFGLAKSLGISKEEAAAFIEGYFARYPGVAGFIHDTLAACRRQGYVTTILGRRRAISGVRYTPPRSESLLGDSPAPLQLNLPERTAVNTVIQGTAADLIKLAMIAVDQQLRHRHMQTRMILQIHDELVFDAPEEELADLSEMVRHQMQNVLQLGVPLKVDINQGITWADC